MGEVFEIYVRIRFNTFFRFYMEPKQAWEAAVWLEIAMRWLLLRGKLGVKWIMSG
jgi:hypothetical protein